MVNMVSLSLVRHYSKEFLFIDLSILVKVELVNHGLSELMLEVNHRQKFKHDVQFFIL